jgi:hypothetical protein
VFEARRSPLLPRSYPSSLPSRLPCERLGACDRCQGKGVSLQQRHLGRCQPGVAEPHAVLSPSGTASPPPPQRVKQPARELMEPRLQVRICTSAFSTSDATMQWLYVRPHGLHTLMRLASRKAVHVDAMHWHVLCRLQYSSSIPPCQRAGLPQRSSPAHVVRCHACRLPSRSRDVALVRVELLERHLHHVPHVHRPADLHYLVTVVTRRTRARRQRTTSSVEHGSVRTMAIKEANYVN